jgi:hypothetical protein
MPGPGRLARVLFLLLAALAVRPAALSAQLISPGKLSRPHAALDGVGNCTACHELGKRGVDEARCLKCHEPLARRIAAKEGLHATYMGKACAECHKEHFGLEFAVLRFDSTHFDHKQTGYPLVMAHDTASCRSCHRPDYVTVPEAREYATKNGVLGKTYLGLDRHCVSCHVEDDPHVGQFKAKGCDECHNEATWKEVPRFSHQRTKYPLTGAHQNVACAKCHEPNPPGAPPEQAGYVNVAFAQCTDCHTDPHQGRMRGTCESCHTTDGWRGKDRKSFEATFDHSRTRFALEGAHKRASCAACHLARAPGDTVIKLTFVTKAGMADYPPPVADDCLSCHLDAHRGAFAKTPGGMGCDNCHGLDAWRPTTYDAARHNRETYRLDGAHLAVPCEDCHTRPAPGALPRFRLGPVKCADCHARDDKHGEQFAGRLCTECHTTATFKIAAFDHSRTRYPLDGAHRDLACASCHHTETTPAGPVVRYRPLGTECRSCHGATG